MSSLKRRAMVSLAASYASQLGQTAANFAIKILLARMIAPAQWGVYAEAAIVICVADIFTDLGLTQHVIREKNRPYGNVFLIRLIMSFVCMAAILVFAPLLGYVLSPEIVTPVRGLVPLVLLRALISVPRTYLDRELMIHKTLVPQIAGLAAMGAVSLPMARMHYGVWALVAGTVASETVTAVLLWISVRRTIPLEFRLDYTRHLLRGSRYLFLIALVGFMLQQGDIAITGALLPVKQVGLYAMAFTIVSMASKAIELAVYRVAYPMFCEYSTDVAKVGRIYKAATVAMLSIEAPVFFFLLFNSHFVVGLILSAKWQPIAPILAGLAPAGLVNKFSTFGMEVLRAAKRDRWLTLTSVTAAASLGIFGYLLTRRYGSMGMVAANYIALGSVVMAAALYNIIRDEFVDLSRKVGVIYLLAFAAAAAPVLLLPGPGALPHLIGMLSVPASWLIFYRLYWKSIGRPALMELE